MKYLFIIISTLLSFNVFAVSCIEIPSGDGSFTVEIPYGYSECEVDTGSDSSGVAGLFVGGALAYFLINRTDPDTKDNFLGFLQGNGIAIKKTQNFELNFMELNRFKTEDIENNILNDNRFNIISLRLKY